MLSSALPTKWQSFDGANAPWNSLRRRSRLTSTSAAKRPRGSRTHRYVRITPRANSQEEAEQEIKALRREFNKAEMARNDLGEPISMGVG
jgi:hypothetical protein